MAHGLNPGSMVVGSTAAVAAMSSGEILSDGRVIFRLGRFHEFMYRYGAFTCDPYTYFQQVEGQWCEVDEETVKLAVGYRLPRHKRRLGVGYEWRKLKDLTDSEWETYFDTFPNVTGQKSREEFREWHSREIDIRRVIVNDLGEMILQKRDMESPDGCWLCYCGVPDMHGVAAAARARRGG